MRRHRMLEMAHSLDHLEALVNDPEIYTNSHKSHETINKISKYLNKGHDLKHLLLPVIKLLSHNDIIVKKFACQFISRYSHDSDVIILCVCSLLRDAHSSNPIVRGMAIKTLTCLKVTSVLDSMTQVVTDGFKDKSAYVRRNAVMACLSLHELNGNLLSGDGYVNKLYGFIRDSDPIVVVNCLRVLDEVLVEEGGIVMNKNVTYYLLNDLSRFTDCQLVTVLEFISKYTPQDDNEVIDIINILDSYLQSGNLCTAIMALRYTLKIVKDNVDMRRKIVKRSSGVIVSTLCRGYPEEIYNLLEYLETIPESFDVLKDSLAAVYTKYCDPPYLKIKKLTILPKLATQLTYEEILGEMITYSSDHNIEVSKAAMSSLSDIMQQFTNSANYIRVLKYLINQDIDHVTINTLNIMQNCDPKLKSELSEVFQLITSNYKSITTIDGKLTFLQLLAEYRNSIPDTPYILENAIDQWFDSDTVGSNSKLKSSFLTTTMKILTFPAQIGPILERVVESCWSDHDVDLCDRTRFYYQLLKTDPKLATTVIIGDLSDQ